MTSCTTWGSLVKSLVACTMSVSVTMPITLSFSTTGNLIVCFCLRSLLTALKEVFGPIVVKFLFITSFTFDFFNNTPAIISLSLRTATIFSFSITTRLLTDFDSDSWAASIMLEFCNTAITSLLIMFFALIMLSSKILFQRLVKNENEELEKHEENQHYILYCPVELHIVADCKYHVIFCNQSN